MRDIETVARLAIGEVEHVGRCRQHLGRAEHAGVLVRAHERDVKQLGDALDLRAELAVQLVTTDPREVVATWVEERVLEVDAGCVERKRLARTCALVDLEQRLVPRRDQLALALPLGLEEVEMAHEAAQERFVLVSEGAQHDK
jgi:hypothetical protein